MDKGKTEAQMKIHIYTFKGGQTIPATSVSVTTILGGGDEELATGIESSSLSGGNDGVR